MTVHPAPKLYIGGAASSSSVYRVVAEAETARGNEVLPLRIGPPLAGDVLRDEIMRMETAYRRLFLNPGGHVSYEIELLVAYCLMKKLPFEWMEKEGGERYLTRRKAALENLMPMVDRAYRRLPEPPPPDVLAEEAAARTNPNRAQEVLGRQQAKARAKAEERRKAAEAARKARMDARRAARAAPPPAPLTDEPPGRLPATLPAGTRLRPGAERLELDTFAELSGVSGASVEKRPFGAVSLHNKPRPAQGFVYRLSRGRFVLVEDVDWATYKARG